MRESRVLPALADLSQDIAGVLPLELLLRWARSPRDTATAEALLAGYRLEGQVVSSDTSGLTRLTEERDLLDVMALISRPKEVVHGLGTAIGGRPIGTWVADNTQMFYPPSVDGALLLDAMIEARARAAAVAPIGIGMCLHAGTFYEIGGGLYGADADTVECLAEDHAGPGEILVTRPWLARLAAPLADRLHPRPELAAACPAGVFAVESSRRRPDLVEHDRDYPPPFPRTFLEALRGLGAGGDDALRQATYGRYQQERTVLFVAPVLDSAAASPLAMLLERFLANALVDAVVKERLGLGDHVYGAGQGYVILVFPEPRTALAAAGELRAHLAAQGLDARLGMDHGPVLTFHESPGPRQIAGGAVNLASKLSEDVGLRGVIQVTDRAAQLLPEAAAAPRFAVEVSGVRITGVRI
jgi:hypothetical protein